MSAQMGVPEMLATKAPITFEIACKVWGDAPNLCDDKTRKCFFAVWALMCFEWAEAMVDEAQNRKVGAGKTAKCAHKNRECTYESDDGEFERWRCKDCGERWGVEIAQ